MVSISFELQNLYSHHLKTLQQRPCQNKMRLSCLREIGTSHRLIVPPHKISKLCKHSFIVSKSCSALPYPQNITNKIHFQIQHVERRLLEGLTGQAVENAGKRKHFYSATAYQSRLSLHSVEFIVNMASYGHHCVTSNSLVGI